MSSSEADTASLAWARAQVRGLIEELDIRAPALKLELLADPERALKVLRHASTQRGIRNRAAFAIARWRAGGGLRALTAIPEAEAELELEPGPPTLADIERVWSNCSDDVAAVVLGLMAASITRAGGFHALR